MPYYEVELERTQRQTVLIQAKDTDEAQEGARELADSWAWEDIDDSEMIQRLPRKPRQRYWTGGEQGKWVDP